MSFFRGSNHFVYVGLQVSTLILLTTEDPEPGNSESYETL